MQRARAVQVGLLMRSYRESFSPGGGRWWLTQEALLERMGSVDSDYAERYSHATVSRWESGGTRHTRPWVTSPGAMMTGPLAGLGLSREEALAGLNLGYMWPAIWVFAFMSFVVGGRLIVSIYRIDGGRRR